MIRDYKERERVTENYYRRDFQVIGEPAGCGYSFDCDKDGNLTGNPAQLENFEHALAHPEKFQDLGVQMHTSSYTEPARGICHCGEEVFLINQYMGACECPNCGQWYNIFGQELMPPANWEE